MLKLENSIRGLSFSRVAFDLTIQGIKYILIKEIPYATRIHYNDLNIILSSSLIWFRSSFIDIDLP